MKTEGLIQRASRRTETTLGNIERRRGIIKRKSNATL
jgi:hypothetical protein